MNKLELVCLKDDPPPTDQHWRGAGLVAQIAVARVCRQIRIDTILKLPKPGNHQ